MTTWSTQRKGQAVFAGCLAALGIFILHETMGMPAGPAYSAVGPRAFPGFIGVGLVIVGLFQLQRSIVGESDISENVPAQLDWRAVVWVCSALFWQILLLPWVGWIPGAMMVFVGVSRAFGSHRLVLDLIIGLSLAVTTFVLFNLVLGLNLPVGKLFSAVIGT